MNTTAKLIKLSIKIIAILLIGLVSSISVHAQKYMTKNGNIMFYSETPMETIKAVNEQVNAVLDTQTGDIVCKILIKSFQFPKALMQEHFNENYLESDKFPNSTFKGKITNLSAINFSKGGIYDALIEGDMTIHGVTKNISEKGTFTVKSGDKIHGTSKFNVKPADYNIKIPGAVVKNIAETIEVTVDIELSKI
ncbi:MAG: YceI family protein [Bacteroidales bacterium]|nr:YceI family protein [Bacteroidales bacterium]